MAEIAITLAISAAVSAGTTALQYALTPKPKKPAPIDRGKLDDTRLSIPAYGAQIIKTWGTFRCAPTWFWHTPAIDIPVTTPGQSGGKGGGAPPSADVTEHRYFKNMAGVFHDGQIQHVSRIWFDTELVMNTPLATNLATTASNRYEAEDAVKAGTATVAIQAECSGGRKVAGIGNGGSVTIHCDVTATATYEVAVAYTSTVDRVFQIAVNGGAPTSLSCPSSGGAGLVAVQTISLALTAGANTISFDHATLTAPDLDYITIAPALSFVEGVDRRSFTGIQIPERLAPTDPDVMWPVNDELPVFTDPTGGLAGDNQQTATLSKWGNPKIRIYLGSETQMPDPLIESIKGVGNTSAYRGTAYIVIEGVQAQNGHWPNVTIEFEEGTRSASAILTSLAEMVGLTASDLDVSALDGLILGDSEGFNPGTYTPITWTGLNNATQSGGGAITKTSGTNNAWNAYAVQGTTVSAGTDAAIRFTAGTGVFMIGFSTTATPGSTLPNPYNQVLCAVLLNTLGNPSQTAKNAMQMSLGGTSNTTDVGVWARGDVFQVEIRNGRFMVYQNGRLMGGFTPPSATFPLHPIFVGYAIGGGPSAASYATGANIGSEPIILNAGALVLDSQREASELVEELMTRFQFVLPEVDSKIKAVRLDAASDLTLTEAECQAYRGDGQPPKIEISRKNPLTFPKKTIVNYSDAQLDYHANAQVETRLYGPQKGTLPVTLAMVETGANMKQLAAILSSRAEVEGQVYKFTVGPKHKHIHQGTVLTITEGSSTHVIRVINFRPDLPAGLCEVEAVRQSSVFNPSVVTTPVGVEAPIVPIPGATKGVFIDAPLVEPGTASGDTDPAVYVAMCGRGSGNWPAGILHREFPLNSGNYIIVTTSDKPATIGVTDNALGSVAFDDIDDIDTVNTITLDLYFGELESVTEADLLANPKLNLLYVGSEYLQFQTATSGVAMAPFVRRYTLSNLRRGRFGTQNDVSLHIAGDEAVLMNSAVKVLPMDNTRLGQEDRYKFVTAGMALDAAAEVLFTWWGVNLKPDQPTGIKVYRDTKTGLLANQVQVVIPTRRDHAVGGTVKYWVDVYSATAGPAFTADASANTLTSTAHGLTANDVIALSTTGKLPYPLQKNRHYYLRDITANTFKLANSQGGSAIDLQDTGTGTHNFTRRVRHVPVVNFGAFNPAVLTVYTPNDTPPPDGEWQHATAVGSNGWDSTITTEWTQRNDVVGNGPGAAGGGITAAALALITEAGAEAEFTLGTVQYEPGSETSVYLNDPAFDADGNFLVYREMRFSLFTDGALPASSKAGSRRWKLTIHERATVGGTLNLVYTDPDLELPGMRYRMQISGTELRYYRDYGGPNSELLYRSTVPLIFPLRVRCDVATEHRINNIKIGGLQECITTYPDTDMIADFGTQPATLRLRAYEERVVSGIPIFGDVTDFIT